MSIIKRLLLFVMPIFFTNIHATPAIVIGKPLPKWRQGYLDIHHIHEGRGNATFMVFPDGTTLLYDVGDVSLTNLHSNNLQQYSGVLPNNSKLPYEWVAEYIKQFSPYPNSLDYLVISHYHFDHMGEWDVMRKQHPEGHYRLFGVTGIFEEFHVHTLIDRSYPDYQQHGDMPGNLSSYLDSRNEYGKITALTMQDYQRFIQFQKKKNKLDVEKFQVGNNSQIHLVKHPYENFQVRNIIGNGYVWTGKNNNTYHFIQYAQNDIHAKKRENDLALGFRIDYGKFRYFTGSDITGLDMAAGKQISTSAEAVAAPVIGRVDVATLDHHGFADAQSERFVAALRPQVWIQQNWAASQTTMPMLLRIFDRSIYFHMPDLFTLHHFQLNNFVLPVNGKSKADKSRTYYKDALGHIVVRVMPGGKSYWVIMLTSNTAHPVVKAFYGPYNCQEH